MTAIDIESFTEQSCEDLHYTSPVSGRAKTAELNIRMHSFQESLNIFEYALEIIMIYGINFFFIAKILLYVYNLN